ncbi:Uncharacterized protein TCM_034648 [Theobroma cacao]|uniref:Uncharacterized protein n=1 Tax=Theobroma cacao TaxID=3641 RepID=A0A061FME9_THECC|nr:Uncharacterized protein TCM_034648 [Theobroma cacao]
MTEGSARVVSFTGSCSFPFFPCELFLSTNHRRTILSSLSLSFVCSTRDIGLEPAAKWGVLHPEAIKTK